MKLTILHQTPAHLPLLLLACACSADVLDLGGGAVQAGGVGSGRCASSTVLTGDVVVTRQSDLEALAGCEEVTGDLRVALFPEASLLPLSSLRVVGGAFELGIELSQLVPTLEVSAEEAALEVARAEAQREQGWLASLEGLEELTRVGSLLMAHVLAPDLHALRRLEALQGIGVGRASGGLRLVGAKNLRDLSGLENLWVESLALADNPLESLDGLVLADTLLSVSITNHPNLRDIQALSSVRDIVGPLLLSGTALESLEALAGLERVTDGIALIENTRLSDVSQLSELRFAADIQIRDNDLLTSLPSFEKLEALDSLYIVDNAALEQVQLPGGVQWSGMFFELGDGQTESHSTPALRIEIQRNASLQRFTSSGGPLAVQFLTIEDNPALTQVELPTTERVDSLSLTRNATLADVDMPLLRTVDSLEVLDNPALSASAFADVKTFERIMAGNADTP